MATGEDLRRLALALPGTVEAPHVDRRAFRVARIYVTLHPDALTANFKFTPEDQALKCLVAPEAFAPVPGGWGRMGWTTATLAHLTEAELALALETAWRDAQPKPKRR
ncbi:MmcQ/YjbR family DNA-binding protein [Prosthecodimorpha staleyi]|uniref:MmcQ/YjbR family DNA-binding protein n=1 Tax=Prosthecodimorpha staleyi TaxID=2840188 RepID=A0A947GDR3_9HYPH|nr:MmcQ/YjbR family DNA-binding protein [Prosthecodimorpha staleyi]MBT9288545.1 MmcQ/YjbR family DNA-binding protein [Prosthecodimorpha staleyi]